MQMVPARGAAIRMQIVPAWPPVANKLYPHGRPTKFAWDSFFNRSDGFN